MDYPQCPQHGVGGADAAQTLTASVIRYGTSSPSRPRQIFLCRFELKSGRKGEHRFREIIPRLKASNPVCPHCGGALDDWNGERVLERHWFPALPVADCLVNLAKGESYRKASEALRIATDRRADPSEPRRKSSRYGEFSNGANAAQWLAETWAPILHQALAPQTWPERGILAVDSLKINYSGAVKAARFGKASVSPELHEVDESLDPDDPEDSAALKIFKKIMKAASPKGTAGGLPSWTILGAYGYVPDAHGRFPRGPSPGKPWLFRSYHNSDALTWAHFFRQLPGTPAYILSDMAREIRVGVELAWPDPAKRPAMLTCEWHATEALKRRVQGDPVLITQAGRVFHMYGRRVKGLYVPSVGNGPKGCWQRLWHFAEFRRLARSRGHPEIEPLLATPTWRRIMEQILLKDGTLRYSTGALEEKFISMAQAHIVPRGELFTNRHRTDCLLMLLQLNEMNLATQANFLKAIEAWIAEHGTPTQSRRTDPATKAPTLRAPLTDTDLTMVKLPTRARYTLWLDARLRAMRYRRVKDRYHRDFAFRKAVNRRRVTRLAKSDPTHTYRKTWYRKHAASERARALERKAKLKAEDPEKYLTLRRDQKRRAADRKKKLTTVMKATGASPEDARTALEAVAWDVDQAVASMEIHDANQAQSA